MKATALLNISIPSALNSCTVCFYENSCTQAPDWPAYGCGTREDSFPGAQYVQVENNLRLEEGVFDAY